MNPDAHPADAGDSDILPNLLLFGETLRHLGLHFGSANMRDLIRATQYIPIGDSRSDFHLVRPPAHGRSIRDLRSMGEQRRYRTPRIMPRREDTSDGPPPDNPPDDAGSFTGPPASLSPLAHRDRYTNPHKPKR